MRAAVLRAPHDIALQVIEPPVPGPSEVRIRVEGCGVCGSNIPPFTGRPWFSYPMLPGMPGHEPWGVIESWGRNVSGVTRGQRVAFLADRAFAELVVADADRIVPLPEALADRPMPAEPLACAVNVMERAAIAAGDRVAVIGVGFLGAVLVDLAVQRGATVSVWSRRAFARDIACELGAVEAFDFEAASPETPFDCVIEAAGEQHTLDRASALVRERGRLVIAGYHQDGPRSVNMQSWNWRGLDVINAHERDTARYVEGMRRAVALAADGALHLELLCTHAVPFEDIACAFDAALNRPPGFLKAMVTM
jgi:2-desacetyl-2-hydroxyethyl bacteriochlorophyllide A dehydrogenase